MTLESSAVITIRSRPDAFDTLPRLSSQDARQKFSEVGPNEILTTRPRPLILQLLAYFAQPLVAILLIAALISGISGDWLNAGVIAAIVIGRIGLDFAQMRRSQVAAEGLGQISKWLTALVNHFRMIRVETRAYCTRLRTNCLAGNSWTTPSQNALRVQVSPTATVKRDDAWLELSRKTLVPLPSLYFAFLAGRR